MLAHRTKAKKFLKSIKTIKQFDDYINSLVLSDLEKDIAREVFIKKLSHTQIAYKYNISIEQVQKIICNILDTITFSTVL